jgi:hypothetical protein
MARLSSLLIPLLCALFPTAGIAAEERPRALEAIAGEVGSASSCHCSASPPSGASARESADELPLV